MTASSSSSSLKKHHVVHILVLHLDWLSPKETNTKNQKIVMLYHFTFLAKPIQSQHKDW